MHPFATYVLRSYYEATGWNEDNLYANLTRASHGRSASHFGLDVY
jgi:distribution and morphology protein 10